MNDGAKCNLFAHTSHFHCGKFNMQSTRRNSRTRVRSEQRIAKYGIKRDEWRKQQHRKQKSMCRFIAQHTRFSVTILIIFHCCSAMEQKIKALNDRNQMKAAVIEQQWKENRFKNDVQNSEICNCLPTETNRKCCFRTYLSFRVATLLFVSLLGLFFYRRRRHTLLDIAISNICSFGWTFTQFTMTGIKRRSLSLSRWSFRISSQFEGQRW